MNEVKKYPKCAFSEPSVECLIEVLGQEYVRAFFYTFCPHCGMEYCVPTQCKKYGEWAYREPSENDAIELFCPSCGRKSKLVAGQERIVAFENYDNYELSKCEKLLKKWKEKKRK